MSWKASVVRPTITMSGLIFSKSSGAVISKSVICAGPFRCNLSSPDRQLPSGSGQWKLKLDPSLSGNKALPPPTPSPIQHTPFPPHRWYVLSCKHENLERVQEVLSMMRLLMRAINLQSSSLCCRMHGFPILFVFQVSCNNSPRGRTCRRAPDYLSF